MTSHGDIQRLIPWYVNGTLEEADQDRMNEHLEGCAVCREQVHAEIAFARAVSAALPDMHQLDPAKGRARLLAAVSRPQRSPRRASVALTAALVAVVAVTAFIAGHQIGQPDYRALTTAPAEDRVVLQLIFAPGASEAEVRTVLRATAGTLVTEPSANGVYRIVLPRQTDAANLVQRLRNNGAVRWAALEQP